MTASGASRVAGAWGCAFTALLLIGAGMASVPGGNDAVSEVRAFYAAHAGVVITAQVVGLAASAAFAVFALALRRRDSGLTDRLGRLEVAGLAVAVASVLTVVPPLWLAVVADSASSTSVHRLAVASDLVDVVLFVAIGAFAGVLAAAASATWFSVLSALVAVLATARAVSLLVGSEWGARGATGVHRSRGRHQHAPPAGSATRATSLRSRRCGSVPAPLSDTVEVISFDLARRLREAGLAWAPRNGDWFWLPGHDLDDTVFTVSDMVVDVRDLPTGRVLAFNGTTEWALDAVEERDAVWLPRLDQLLDLLGEHFLGITARSGGHVVRVQLGQREEEHVDVGVTDAVARAMLSVLGSHDGG